MTWTIIGQITYQVISPLNKTLRSFWEISSLKNIKTIFLKDRNENIE